MLTLQHGWPRPRQYLLECLWRSVKCESFYFNRYDTVRHLRKGLTAYFESYDYERLDQYLNYRTLAEEHFEI